MMPQYIFYLGQNPALSAAEVWSSLMHADLKPQLVSANQQGLTVTTSNELPVDFLQRLGGIDRIGQIIGQHKTFPTVDQILDSLGAPLPEKWLLGLSVLGVDQNIKRLSTDLKKAARQRESRLKFTLPDRSGRLNSAQVLFNELHQLPNAEITVAKMGEEFFITRTIQVQDIPKYELRDTSRPARHKRIGMLPPKLAQMMINLAAGNSKNESEIAILDPFCGMGTILQEAWLMGYKSYGSDSSPAMISASKENLAWIKKHFPVNDEIVPRLETADISHTLPSGWRNLINTVVTEPLLGPPLRAPLSPAEFADYGQKLSRLYVESFKTMHSFLPAGAMVLFILPAFHIAESQSQRFTPLPQELIDEISKSGYRMRHLLPEELRSYYGSTDRGSLIYARPDAHVAREVTLWEKVS